VIVLGPEHWEGGVALVAASGLPTADLVPGRQVFWGTVEGDQIVGVIAWERVGDEALVRSFAVHPDRRVGGLGSSLYEGLEAAARSAGIQRLVLLTETAEAFFRRRGFEPTSRSALSEAIQATAEFSGLCPVSAAVLAKTLG